MARLRYWNIVQFVPWILRTQITLISGPEIVWHYRAQRVLEWFPAQRRGPSQQNNNILYTAGDDLGAAKRYTTF